MLHILFIDDEEIITGAQILAVSIIKRIIKQADEW